MGGRMRSRPPASARAGRSPVRACAHAGFGLYSVVATHRIPTGYQKTHGTKRRAAEPLLHLPPPSPGRGPQQHVRGYPVPRVGVRDRPQRIVPDHLRVDRFAGDARRRGAGAESRRAHPARGRADAVRSACAAGRSRARARAQGAAAGQGARGSTEEATEAVRFPRRLSPSTSTRLDTVRSGTS